MNLDSSERSKELGLRISKFMDEHVFPSEKIYLKKVPKLIFLIDDTLDKVEKMNKLFENLEISQK